MMALLYNNCYKTYLSLLFKVVMATNIDYWHSLFYWFLRNENFWRAFIFQFYCSSMLMHNIQLKDYKIKNINEI